LEVLIFSKNKKIKNVSKSLDKVFGIWKDREISAKNIRKEAWGF
jgi:hypothetical protein